MSNYCSQSFDVSVNEDDKIAMADLNRRFVAYVNRVRRLRDEEDVRVINASVSLLEDELRALKQSYEAQIAQLRSALDALLIQKMDLEKELLARRTSECHLNDRLVVETSKNSQLLHEAACLRSDMSSKEQEVSALTLTMKQMRLEADERVGGQQKLVRTLQESQEQIQRYEEKLRDNENQIYGLNQKVEFQDQFFSRKLDEMKGKLEEYLQKMVEMDYKVEDAKQREVQWPGILQRVQTAADEEYHKLKLEAEEYFNETITNIQRQLENEISENSELKKTNEELNGQILQLRRKESELRSKLDDVGRQNHILEQTLQKDKEEANNSIGMLQTKIRQLQDQFNNDLEHAKSGNHSVTIKAEIEFLRRLLAEEEKRLNIKFSINQNQIDKEATDEYQDDEIEGRCINNTSVGDEGYGYDQSRQKAIQNDYGGHEYEDSKTIYNPAVLSESQDIILDDNSYQYADKDERPVSRLSASIGPVCGIQTPIGPVQLGNAVPHPPQERPPRPASANIRGIRTKPYSSESQLSQRDCSSSGSQNRADSGIGQSPDYFDSMFRGKESKDVQAEVTNEAGSVNLTGLKLMEINKDGKFVRIWNASESCEAEIGGYLVKQNRFGHPVALFRFPDRVKLSPNATITVWSGSNDPVLHQPPTDFYSQDPLLWGAGPEYTTILCNPSGQAMSWITPAHRVNPDPYRAKTAPSLRKEARRETNQKLPELTPGYLASANEQVYLIRDIDDDLSHPIHYPYTSTPKSAVHPCYDGGRSKLSTSENSHYNRPGRQKNDSIPDPLVSQTSHSGQSGQRGGSNSRSLKYYPPTIQGSHTINNRTPDVFFRSYTEPPNAFQKPQSRFQTGLDQIQSMHNQSYNPPMYKVDPKATAS